MEKSKTMGWRSKIIKKIADEIRKKSKIFANWMTLETGKTLAEGEAEVQLGCSRYF